MNIHMKRCHEPYLGINIETHIWSGENHADVFRKHHRFRKQMKSEKNDGKSRVKILYHDFRRKSYQESYQSLVHTSHPLDGRRFAN